MLKGGYQMVELPEELILSGTGATTSMPGAYDILLKAIKTGKPVVVKGIRNALAATPYNPLPVPIYKVIDEDIIAIFIRNFYVRFDGDGAVTITAQ